jgi:hypothetical protein
VESTFYRQVAPALLKAGRPAIAEPLAVEADAASGEVTLVLRDLRSQFSRSEGMLDLDHARAALSWLADLHGAYLGRPIPEGLWDEGCFWHLHTRLQELDDVRYALGSVPPAGASSSMSRLLDGMLRPPDPYPKALLPSRGR